MGDAFVWPFRDPGWLEKVVIVGLIGLIPIVGGINAAGWMMASIDRLRAGEERLPPGGFGYLGRGFQLFVVFVVLYLGLLAVAAVFFVPSLLLLGSKGNLLVATFGLALLMMAFAVTLIGSLAIYFVTPAVVLGTMDRGPWGALDLRPVLRRIRRSPTNTLLAGLMLIAAGFIGGLGIYAFFVGLILTFPYSLAMEAWIIRSYEEALHVGHPPAAA